MPDYRRLVSYMYNYEDGIKRNNVGYARVEARNGQCKCTLHIAAPSLNEKQLKAYIFKRNKGGLQGVLLGTFYVRNGIGDYRVITESAHIMNTPYSLDEMGGIVLYLSDKKFFATEWDDSPITKELVSTIEDSQLKKENTEQKTAKEDEIKTETEIKPDASIDRNDESDLVKAADVKVINIKTEYFNQDDLTTDKYAEKDESNNNTPSAEVTQNTSPSPSTENQPTNINNEVPMQPVTPENPCGKLIIETPETGDINLDEDDNTSPENMDENRAQQPVSQQNLDEIELDDSKVEQDDALPGEELFEEKQIKDQQLIDDETVEITGNDERENDKIEINETENDESEIDSMDLDNVFSIPNQKKEYYEEIALDNDELNKEEDLYDSFEEELDQGDVISESLNHENQDSLDEKVEGAECRTEQPRPFFEDHPLAKRIYRSFPRMYPFEDNEIAWCVKIEPQDIGLFPMEAWILGNNSFLLHGYYSYRHLIFARMNDKNGFSYILGVPGIYHNREKFMAKMFGFENFKSVKRKERKTGEFGYWYIPVLLN
ncbi:MAG: hypothetical protein K0S41_562 [Anaerocolumna sp.]|nr:hypothetical protein [Anaerocolumna sp.]